MKWVLLPVVAVFVARLAIALGREVTTSRVTTTYGLAWRHRLISFGFFSLTWEDIVFAASGVVLAGALTFVVLSLAA